MNKKLIGLGLIVVSLIMIYMATKSNEGGGSIIPPVTSPKYELQHWESKQQLKEDIKNLNLDIHNGECYRNWQPDAWSYEHCECINAQIEMANELLKEDNIEEATQLLDYARDNLQHLYEQAYDCTDTSKAWSDYPQFIGDGVADWYCLYPAPRDWLQPSKLIQAFAHYVDVVQDNKNKLQNTNHLDYAERFKDFIFETHVKTLIDQTWQEYEVTKSDGTKEKRGCFGYIINGKVRCQNHNRVAQEYDILLYLYKWTGDKKYKDMYEKWARYFKAALEVKQDTEHLDAYYTWHYHDDDPDTDEDYDDCVEKGQDAWTCSGTAEMWKYTNFDLVPVLHGYKENIFWTKNELKLFRNTLLKAAGSMRANVYEPSTKELMEQNAKVIGWGAQIPRANSWSNEFAGTAQTWGWIDLAMIDKEVFDFEEEIQHNEYTYQKQHNDFWRSSYYECVANPLVDPENPICKIYEQNPAWRMLAMVKLYKYAK